MPFGTSTPSSMTDPRQRHAMLLRAVYLPLAAFATAALVAQLFVTLGLNGVSTGTRVVRMLSYFTIQSNILVAVSSWGLVIRPQRAGLLWRIVRLDALAGIAVTGIVYSIALAGTQELHGWALACDVAFHYVVPIATVLTWLVFGPRGRIDSTTVLGGLIWPVLWFGYTLLHGAVSDWYPYHFVDVGDLGYPRALLNALIITVLLGVVLTALWLIDQRANSLTGRGVQQRARRPALRGQGRG
ncbi:MAG: Pr6Pr family membrane protein [Actinomycetales bacterium]